MLGDLLRIPLLFRGALAVLILFFSGFIGVLVWMTPFFILLLISPSSYVNTTGRLLATWLRFAMVRYQCIVVKLVRIRGIFVSVYDEYMLFIEYVSRR